MGGIPKTSREEIMKTNKVLSLRVDGSWEKTSLPVCFDISELAAKLRHSCHFVFIPAGRVAYGEYGKILGPTWAAYNTTRGSYSMSYPDPKYLSPKTVYSVCC